MLWVLVALFIPVASGGAILWMVATEGHLERRRRPDRYIPLQRTPPPEVALPR